MDAPGLARQFGLAAFAVQQNTEGMTQEQSLCAPPAGGNCANWVLGHIVHTRSAIAGLIGGEPFTGDDHEKLYGRGSAPIVVADKAVQTTELLQHYTKSNEQLQAFLAGATDEDLAQALPEPHEILGSTVGEALTAFAFHEAYHSGQLGILRRVMGKPGALS
jgi:uncharacterized damage-inducible protein DinB